MPKDCLDAISRYNIRKAKPDPARCALLVIDMQRFFQPIPDPIIDKVNGIIAHARSSGAPVVYTRHGHQDLSIGCSSFRMPRQPSMRICMPRR